MRLTSKQKRILSFKILGLNGITIAVFMVLTTEALKLNRMWELISIPIMISGFGFYIYSKLLKKGEAR